MQSGPFAACHPLCLSLLYQHYHNKVAMPKKKNIFMKKISFYLLFYLFEMSQIYLRFLPLPSGDLSFRLLAGLGKNYQAECHKTCWRGGAWAKKIPYYILELFWINGAIHELFLLRVTLRDETLNWQNVQRLEWETALNCTQTFSKYDRCAADIRHQVSLKTGLFHCIFLFSGASCASPIVPPAAAAASGEASKEKAIQGKSK